ncbi:MAG: hypothetical protein ACFE8N_15205 [Promethearchaeota archaeon]
MNLLDSVVFLLLLIAFLYVIKADLFFMIFGTVVLLYFLILLFFMDPLEILFATIEFIFLNPFGFIIIFIPLVTYIFLQKLKKKKNTH